MPIVASTISSQPTPTLPYPLLLRPPMPPRFAPTVPSLPFTTLFSMLPLLLIPPRFTPLYTRRTTLITLLRLVFSGHAGIVSRFNTILPNPLPCSSRTLTTALSKPFSFITAPSPSSSAFPTQLTSSSIHPPPSLHLNLHSYSPPLSVLPPPT